MENIPLYTILSGSSVILSVLGLYFVAKICVRWKKMDKDVLKARVFLNKKFLTKNWTYVFLSGASMTVHQSIEFLSSLYHVADIRLESISEIFEFITLVFIVVLAYEWYRIIYLEDKPFLFSA
ncbi:MAG: hypothetical protein O8C66_15905 [Candidatus Methanoperedens sp.]|nr:hypothetical protein [Candidatus Methanoperedens sp.]MCZ7371980.1 hypothetical protein [Candidatus Methanoperedens sp.]